jgi:hypothetical protein
MSDRRDALRTRRSSLEHQREIVADVETRRRLPLEVQ